MPVWSFAWRRASICFAAARAARWSAGRRSGLKPGTWDAASSWLMAAALALASALPAPWASSIFWRKVSVSSAA